MYNKNILYSHPLIICHRKNTIKKLISTPIKYGIEITKPWNKEMYAHNDDVAFLQKEQLFA